MTRLAPTAESGPEPAPDGPGPVPSGIPLPEPDLLRVPPAVPGAHGEPGLLIVLEGIDRAGRSTHVRGLEAHLRHRGLGVTRTSLGTSTVAAEPIRRARHERRLDPLATALLDAADLAERLELVIGPALRAGLVVLADRYAYTPFARAAARGVDPDWLGSVFSFCPSPDAVLWLALDPARALERRSSVLDEYEAGLDLGLAADVRENYLLFGARLASWFERLAPAARFTRIDAEGTPEVVAGPLVAEVDRLVAGWTARRRGGR